MKKDSEKDPRVLTAELAARMKSAAEALPDRTKLADILLRSEVRVGAEFSPEVKKWLEATSGLEMRQKAEVNRTIIGLHRFGFSTVEDIRNMAHFEGMERIRGVRDFGPTRFQFIKELFPTPVTSA